MDEIIKAIRTGKSPFEVLYHEYYKLNLSKQELLALCKELLYQIELCEEGRVEVLDVLDNVADKMEELFK